MSYRQVSAEEASSVIVVVAERAIDRAPLDARPFYNEESDLWLAIDDTVGDGMIELRWSDGRELRAGCPYYALSRRTAARADDLVRSDLMIINSEDANGVIASSAAETVLTPFRASRPTMFADAKRSRGNATLTDDDEDRGAGCGAVRRQSPPAGRTGLLRATTQKRSS